MKFFTLAGLILSGFSSPSIFADGIEFPTQSIVGTWRWEETVTPVEKIIPIPGTEYLVSFHQDGSISIILEVNQINGSYEINGKELKVIPPMISTLAAWLPGSPAPSFLILMEHAAGYFFKEGELYIDTYADGGTLRFAAVN